MPKLTEKKVFATAKICTSVTNLPKAENFWTLLFLTFYYLKICYDEMVFTWNTFCQCFSAIIFSLKHVYVISIMRNIS